MIIERIAKDLVRSLDMKILLVIAFAIGLSACGPHGPDWYSIGKVVVDTLKK